MVNQFQLFEQHLHGEEGEDDFDYGEEPDFSDPEGYVDRH